MRTSLAHASAAQTVEITVAATQGRAGLLTTQRCHTHVPRAAPIQLASRSLTRQINEALRTADDDSNAAAAAAGRSHLADRDDW